MDHPILTVSERGQITIPQAFREQMKVKYFICRMEGDHLVLDPLQTKQEFLNELDEAEKGWKMKGGATLKVMKKKHNL